MGRVVGTLALLFAGLAVPLGSAESGPLLQRGSRNPPRELSFAANDVNSCTLSDCSEAYPEKCNWLCYGHNVEKALRHEMDHDANKTVARIQWWVGKVIAIIAGATAGGAIFFAIIFVQCADCWGDQDTFWRRFGLFIQWRDQRSKMIICSLLWVGAILAGLLITGAVLITKHLANAEQYAPVGDMLHQLLTGFHAVSDVVGKDGGEADWALMMRNSAGAGSLFLEKFQGKVRVADNVAATFALAAGATILLAEGEEKAVKLKIKGNSQDQWAAAALSWLGNLVKDKTTVTFEIKGDGKRAGSTVNFDAVFNVPFADMGDWDSDDLFGSGMPYEKFVHSIAAGMSKMRLSADAFFEEDESEETLLQLGESSISMAEVLYIQLILAGLGVILFLLFFFMALVVFSRCCMLSRGVSERRRRVMERVKQRQLQNYAANGPQMNGAPPQMQGGFGLQGQPQQVVMAQQPWPPKVVQMPQQQRIVQMPQQMPQQVIMVQQQQQQQQQRQVPVGPSMIGVSAVSAQQQGMFPQQMAGQQRLMVQQQNQFQPLTSSAPPSKGYLMPSAPRGGATSAPPVISHLSSGPDFRFREKE